MSHKNIEKRKEYQREYQRKWRENHPERWKATYQKSHKKHSESYKPRRNAYLRKYMLQKRIEALHKYGGKCVCCGEKNSNFLSFDHVGNNGHEQRKVIKSSRTFYYLLCKNSKDENIRILCFNCNMGRQFFGGIEKICPHKIKKESL